ncbi:MAG: hypothetical protein KDC38_08935 [Planctomycetes bacterium]|nr:hypothetical protein [Planctomycetota bacterium]
MHSQTSTRARFPSNVDTVARTGTNSRRRARFARAWSLLALLLSAGCAGTPSPIFDPVDPPIVWPDAGPPRVRYVGSLASSDDLRAPVGFWTHLWRWFAGAPEPARLEGPYGLAVADGDQLFIADPEQHCVHHFDLDGRAHARWTDAGDGMSFRNPVDVAISPSGEVVVSDAELGRVVWLDRNGSVRRVSPAELELQRPVGLAIGPRTGRTYIVDVLAHAVRVVEGDGSPGPSLGGRGGAPGQFNFPLHIACDENEHLFVTDSLNFRVQELDRNGAPLRSYGRNGDGPGDFAQPRDVAIDSAGRLFVVDARFENVQIFDRDGRILLGFGHEGHDAGEFWLPKGIWITPDGRIWVGDTYNRRVQVFELLEVADAS